MGQERIIHAALLGAGTVGSGVYKLVKDLEEEIVSKTGARLVVDKILVRDTTKAREGIPSELLIDRWDEILNDPKIEIVIEVMGGIRPALTWLEEALRAGKQVVTANKDLLAEYGEQLFDAAALLFRVRFGTDTNGMQLGITAGIETYFIHHFRQASSIAGNDMEASRPEIRNELDLPLGISCCCRYGQAT